MAGDGLLWWHWLLIYLLVFVATVVQASIGFGFGLFAAPILMIWFPQLLPGPLLVASFSLTITMSVRGWRWVRLDAIFWMIAGVLPGLWIGAQLMQHLAPHPMAILFGLLVLTAVALSASGHHPPVIPATLFPAGVCAAVMAVTTTMSGPPVALVLQNLPGAWFRHTLALFFSLTGLLTMASLALIERMGWPELSAGLALIPPVLAGFLLARHVNPWLDQRRQLLRLLILTVAGAAGVVVMVRAWLTWP